MDWTWILVITLGVIVWAISRAVASSGRGLQERRAEFSTAARQLGLRVERSFEPLALPFALFQRPASSGRTVAESSRGSIGLRIGSGEIREHHADTVFHGVWKGSAVWTFNYAYGEGVSGTLYHDEATCCVVQLSSPLPALVIVGANGSDLSPLWGYGEAFPDGPPLDSIALPTEAGMLVYCNSEGFARSFLDDQMLAWIEADASGAEIEVSGPWGLVTTTWVGGEGLSDSLDRLVAFRHLASRPRPT